MSDHQYPPVPKMNQQCKVCGEPAAGFHFGAFTCEGCKSFFGRSYNNLSSISECKNGGQCVINKKNRTSCKACRLRKCLVVGMSKSGSRYGRRSNWFKIHCLLQEQANNNNNHHNNNGEHNLHHRVYDDRKSPNQHHQHNQLPSPNTSRLMQQQFASLASRPMKNHHEDMDDYKTSSPSISSPESHNSDSSVEISDARLGLLNGHLAAMRQNKVNNICNPKDFFMPLPFLPPGLMQSSPFAAAAAAAMAAQHAQKFMFPSTSPNNPFYGLYSPQMPVVKPERPESEEMLYTKRFYLDAILQSQRSSPKEPIRRETSPSIRQESPPLQEKLSYHHEKIQVASPPIIQDNPIDLSMKSSRPSSENESHMDSDEEEDLDSSENSIKNEISDHEETDSETVIPKGRVTPLDLTTRLETAA